MYSTARTSTIAALSMAMATLWGCAEPAGENISGVVNAPVPLVMPLSKEKACVGRILVSRTSDSALDSSGKTGHDEHQWASGATLTVDGQALQIIGNKGRPSYTRKGEEWRWDASTRQEVPNALRGWGHNEAFEALNSPAEDMEPNSLIVTEEYTPCGESISVRAINSGKSLELVDTGATESDETFRSMASILLGLFCVLLLPITLLIVFVVRRAKKANVEPS